MDIEIFKLVVEASKQNYQDYLYNVWTTLGAVMLATGWILTSKETHKFISGDLVLKNISIGIVFLLLIVHISVLFSAFQRSNELLFLLETSNFAKINNLNDAYLKLYIIPCHWPYISSLINGSLFLNLAYMLFKLESRVIESTQN